MKVKIKSACTASLRTSKLVVTLSPVDKEKHKDNSWLVSSQVADAEGDDASCKYDAVDIIYEYMDEKEDVCDAKDILQQVFEKPERPPVPSLILPPTLTCIEPPSDDLTIILPSFCSSPNSALSKNSLNRTPRTRSREKEKEKEMVVELPCPALPSSSPASRSTSSSIRKPKRSSSERSGSRNNNSSNNAPPSAPSTPVSQYSSPSPRTASFNNDDLVLPFAMPTSFRAEAWEPEDEIEIPGFRVVNHETSQGKPKRPPSDSDTEEDIDDQAFLLRHMESLHDITQDYEEYCWRKKMQKRVGMSPRIKSTTDSPISKPGGGPESWTRKPWIKPPLSSLEEPSSYTFNYACETFVNGKFVWKRPKQYISIVYSDDEQGDSSDGEDGMTQTEAEEPSAPNAAPVIVDAEEMDHTQADPTGGEKRCRKPSRRRQEALTPEAQADGVTGPVRKRNRPNSVSSYSKKVKTASIEGLPILDTEEARLKHAEQQKRVASLKARYIKLQKQLARIRGQKKVTPPNSPLVLTVPIPPATSATSSKLQDSSVKTPSIACKTVTDVPSKSSTNTSSTQTVFSTPMKPSSPPALPRSPSPSPTSPSSSVASPSSPTPSAASPPSSPACAQSPKAAGQTTHLPSHAEAAAQMQQVMQAQWNRNNTAMSVSVMGGRAVQTAPSFMHPGSFLNHSGMFGFPVNSPQSRQAQLQQLEMVETIAKAQARGLSMAGFEGTPFMSPPAAGMSTLQHMLENSMGWMNVLQQARSCHLPTASASTSNGET
eukprot:gb/GEZN01001799.1/.p1 GENE.gb/GEZN01001799.1/~~gb/GEZN01001799.1/.p1  ORF type:complete len:769 (+),score=163.08 gb/GEZN01001799.1/:258-2564(+)